MRTTNPTYLAAQKVSATISTLFEQHLAKARISGEQELADKPETEEIEKIIDTAFWASLRKEEGHSPRISLAYLSPEQAGQPIVFEHRMPLTPAILTKLAPGFERPGIHLGIWKENKELYVWGATLQVPNCCFVLDVSEPGMVVVKHRRPEGFGKFSNIAVLTGDEVKIVDERNALLPDYPSLPKSLFNGNMLELKKDTMNVLLQLAVSMRAHRRGGTLLVVPSDTPEWLKSIRKPL
ncbi:MAG TPA: hypothetical protein VK766_05090, partial [Cytophagaceae bacterium]|nr:hypothetical protein [Cytophagaceae bacterium]